jgi:hypothetical protein
MPTFPGASCDAWKTTEPDYGTCCPRCHGSTERLGELCDECSGGDRDIAADTASQDEAVDRAAALTVCLDCTAPASVTSEDGSPRCTSCDRDEENRIEHLRGGEPDREAIAAMRERQFGEGR